MPFSETKQSNQTRKLFIEREREREGGYLHGEEERVAREEIRVWEVRRERAMKSFGSAR